MQLAMCRTCLKNYLDESEIKEIPDFCKQTTVPIRDIKRCSLAQNGNGAEDWQVPEDWNYEKLRDWFIDEGFSHTEITDSALSSFYVNIGKNELCISTYEKSIRVDSPIFRKSIPYVEFYIPFSLIGGIRHLKYPTSEVNICGKDRKIIASILDMDAGQVQKQLKEIQNSNLQLRKL